MLPQCELLDTALADARQPLVDYLLDDYHKQTHITVYAAGFPCDVAQLRDDVSQAELDRQEAAIRQLALPSIKLTTAALNSFAGAPFVEVVDDAGQLQSLHQRLCDVSGEDRDGVLIPHLTLGLYRDAFPVGEVAGRLQERVVMANAIRCNTLHLLAYAAADIRSPLQILRTIFLG